MVLPNKSGSLEPRQFLTSLFHAAVAAADPLLAIRANLPERPTGRTVVVGAGKGAAQMARALESLWDGPISGAVVTRYGFGCETRHIEVLEAAHPVPDAAGLEAGMRIKSLVADLQPDDLVIALICGGGSALLSAPAGAMSLSDEVEVNQQLLASGAPISAMNVVRKHLSTIKGGRLAAATRARVFSLIISDIPGDNPAHVASGPTVPDLSTRHDALDIVSQYGLKLPAAAMAHLQSSDADAPMPDSPVFRDHQWRVVASASVSLAAAAAQARSQGVEAVVLSDSIEGEAKDVGLVQAAIARQVARNGQPFSTPVVILSGGETTVSMGQTFGRGGRNAEFALSFANAVDGVAGIHLLAADTDGVDGSETNAGAFADTTTASRLRAAGLSPKGLLSGHDAYSAFEALGDLFETGPTGTNVNDFRAILISDWRMPGR